ALEVTLGIEAFALARNFRRVVARVEARNASDTTLTLFDRSPGARDVEPTGTHRTDPCNDDSSHDRRPPPGTRGPAAPAPRGDLLYVLLNVLDRVADGRNLLGVLIWDIDLELLFECENELDDG